MVLRARVDQYNRVHKTPSCITTATLLIGDTVTALLELVLLDVMNVLSRIQMYLVMAWKLVVMGDRRTGGLRTVF